MKIKLYLDKYIRNDKETAVNKNHEMMFKKLKYLYTEGVLSEDIATRFEDYFEFESFAKLKDRLKDFKIPTRQLTLSGKVKITKRKKQADLSTINTIDRLTGEVDLEKVDDGLEGLWFHYIRPDFAFMHHIHKGTIFEEDGVLIHKKHIEGEMFPDIRYSILGEDEGKLKAYTLLNKDIKEHMQKLFLVYVARHHKLPFGCSVEKRFKNGNLKIKYLPDEWNQFVLNIDPERFNLSIESIRNILESPIDDNNPLADKRETTRSIEQLYNHSLVNDSTVFIDKAFISKIDLIKDVFREHENYWYLLELKMCDYNDTVNTFKGKLLARCTDKAMKFLKLNVGDKIRFSGVVKQKSGYGTIIQKVRDFKKI